MKLRPLHDRVIVKRQALLFLTMQPKNQIKAKSLLLVQARKTTKVN